MEDSSRNIGNMIHVYIKKYWRIFLRSGGLSNIFMAGITALIVAFVIESDTFVSYSATRTSVFVIICSSIWIGLFNSIQTICTERIAIKRDHKSHAVPYRVFLFAHLALDFLLCLTESTIVMAFVLFCHRNGLLVSGSGSFNFFGILGLYLTVFLVTYASDVLGLMVSAIARTSGEASTAMPFVLILQFIISGFIFRLEGIFKTISDFTISKWGMQAACIALDVNTLSTDVENVGNSSKQQMEVINRYLEYQKSDYIRAYNPADFHFLKSILVLLLFIFAEILIAMIFMKLIDFDKR